MTDLHVPDSPKMLRETLCVAQSRIGSNPLDEGRKREHIDRLQRLLDQCDTLRPLGPDGKHGNLHTPYCGCDFPKEDSMTTPIKPLVFRCDGEDADCDPTVPHWLAMDSAGYVTSWGTWERAMKRATRKEAPIDCA